MWIGLLPGGNPRVTQVAGSFILSNCSVILSPWAHAEGGRNLEQARTAAGACDRADPGGSRDGVRGGRARGPVAPGTSAVSSGPSANEGLWPSPMAIGAACRRAALPTGRASACSPWLGPRARAAMTASSPSSWQSASTCGSPGRPSNDGSARRASAVPRAPFPSVGQFALMPVRAVGIVAAFSAHCDCDPARRCNVTSASTNPVRVSYCLGSRRHTLLARRVPSVSLAARLGIASNTEGVFYAGRAATSRTA